MRILFFLLISFISFAQQNTKVDFKTAKGNIAIDVNQKKVFGTVSYVFEVKESIDTIKIDAQKMTFSDVKINKKVVKFSNSGKTLSLFEGYKKGKNATEFICIPHPNTSVSEVNSAFWKSLGTSNSSEKYQFVVSTLARQLTW